MRPTLLRRTAIIATALFALAACGSSDDGDDGDDGATGGDPTAAAEPVALRMQLSWVPQAQFAGYLVADAMGFYDDANLDVTIIPGGPNVNNIQQMASGEADLAVDRVSTLFQARDTGVPIQGIASLDQESGFWLVGKKSDGIEEPEDLVGKKIGIYSDNEFEFLAMLDEMGISHDDVKTFYQGFTMDPWLNGDYPVAQMVSWNDLQVVYASGLTDDDLTIFKPTDYGVGVLHGAILATEDIVNASPEALTAFVDATMQGWTYAFENPEEAIDIVMDAAQDADRDHETASLADMKLIQWGGEDQAPENWGQIPLDVWQGTADILQDGDYVNGEIDVDAAVDLDIAGQ